MATAKPLDLKKVATLLATIAEAFGALEATFRASAGAGGAASDDGKAGGKPARKSSSKVEAGDDDGGEDYSDATEDDVREALKELIASHGKEAAVAAFGAVGATKLAEVDESEYPALMAKVKELGAEPAEEAEEPPAKPAKKTTARGKAKGPTLDDVTEAAKALIDADKPAYLKLVKKFGKPSECEADQYGAFLKALQDAMPEDAEGEDDLL